MSDGRSDRRARRGGRGGGKQLADERAQAYTLEGVTAGMLLLLIVFVSMQSIVVTPTTEGAVDRDITTQLGTEANDVLAIAHEEEDLKELALAYDPEAENGEHPWRWDDGEWRVGTCPELESGEELGLCTKLEETFSNRYYRYNVHVEPLDGDPPEEPPFEQGVPDDSSATATHTVAIYENMTLTDDDRTVAMIEEAEGKNFYGDDMDDENLYTIVEIRVVVW